MLSWVKRLKFKTSLQGQRLHTLPSPGCSDIQEPRDHVLVEHDIQVTGGQIPVEHDEEQDNTLPFPIQETGQPEDRPHPGIWKYDVSNCWLYGF